MSTVIKLGGTKIAAARRLVDDAISHVDLSGIGKPDDDRHTKCRAFLAATSSTARLPEDLWLGVAGQGGQLVAALHAAPLVGVASPLVELHRRGSTTAGSPGWIARLLREILLVEEIAVLPAERRRGHGAALLRECHRIARARGVKDMQAHAAVEAQEFFRAAGYIVAPRRDAQVPKEYQCDLVTEWSPKYESLTGCWVYNHIDQLS